MEKAEIDALLKELSELRAEVKRLRESLPLAPVYVQPIVVPVVVEPRHVPSPYPWPNYPWPWSGPYWCSTPTITGAAKAIGPIGDSGCGDSFAFLADEPDLYH